jgi:hypothetical protein
MDRNEAPPLDAPFDGWSDELRAELDAESANPRVGTRLVHADARSRIWELRLVPGERLGFHRHVLDYVWTCVSGGNAISHYGDGSTQTVTYGVGETRSLDFARGASMIHDIVNTGGEELVFTTVEFLASENEPLPLDVAAELAPVRS